MSGIFKFKVFVVITTLFFISCQLNSEFDYKDDFPAPQLVVWAFLNETGIHAEIRKTTSPLDIKASDSVEEINISLFEEGIYLFDLEKNNSEMYVSPSNFIPRKEKSYYITAEAAGFGTVTSKAQMLPDKVHIDTVKIKRYTPDYGYNSYSIAYIKFTDPDTRGNSYFVNCISYINGEKHSGSEFIDLFDVFGDEDFNNEAYTKEQEIYTQSHFFEMDTIFFADSIKCYLYSLSPDFKLFAESYKDYELSYGIPDYEQPFKVYSNIDKGAGNFNAYCLDSCTVYLIPPQEATD